MFTIKRNKSCKIDSFGLDLNLPDSMYRCLAIFAGCLKDERALKFSTLDRKFGSHPSGARSDEKGDAAMAAWLLGLLAAAWCYQH